MGVPLAALSINPPAQPRSPLDSYTKAMQIKQMQQANEINQMRMQEAQRQQREQHLERDQRRQDQPAEGAGPPLGPRRPAPPLLLTFGSPVHGVPHVPPHPEPAPTA